ncbi:MAG: hypothetical protein IKO56_05735, partial [Alphaproteobacteria bacterium]|nr:hypothetical protein [Alphaproteobacteria bacterium]
GQFAQTQNRSFRKKDKIRHPRFLEQPNHSVHATGTPEVNPVAINDFFILFSPSTLCGFYFFVFMLGV